MNFKEDFRLKSIELNEKRVIRDAIHDYIHVPVFRSYHYISLELLSNFNIKNTDFFSIF